jgi:hypothetical protein
MTPELVELLVTVHTMMINAGRVFRCVFSFSYRPKVI